MRNKKGFTLLELLVVIFIIALASSILYVSNTGRNRQHSMYSFALLLKAQMQVAREQAILHLQLIGLKINENQYEFYVYQFGKWVALKKIDTFWQTYNIPAGLTIEIQNQTMNDLPQILFYSSGEVSPFQMQIQSATNEVNLIGKKNGFIFAEQT